MSRLAQQFALLKEERRTGLVPYIMAGDPAPWVTVPLMHAMVKAGASVIELGVPFSDPMADGPVIQRAAVRTLKHNITLTDVLNMVREFRAKDAVTPIVLMGYLNPMESMGYETFAQAAAQAGVDGVLTVDLPPEEGDGILPALKAHGLDPIFLVAPTSGPDRLRAVAQAAAGFIYYVSLRGVTGATHLDIGEVSKRINDVRRYSDLPVGVGFGIRDAQTAAAMARIADAVIVGSAVVSRMEQNAGSPEKVLSEVPNFIAELRGALDKAVSTAEAAS